MTALIRLSLCLSFVVAWSSRASANTPITPPPNFIIINVDDLGYGDIGPFGATHVKTPELDRMAREGRKLTSFYAAPVCSPSRAALMTGCYPKRVLPIPHVLFPANPIGLSPDEITIAELLREQGYRTGIIGKWHLGDQPEFLPTQQGFEFYFGLPYSNDMGPAADGIKSNLGAPLPETRAGQRGQPPLPLMHNNSVLRRVLPEDQQSLVPMYTEQAVQFLWDHQDEPFFLYLPHSAVHFPLYPSERFRGSSAHGLFGDWVQEVDWSVGQVLDTVRQLKLEDRTFVLFTSDNGGQPRHGAINAPLRGGKGSVWEGGMRVPTIAWWPDRIPAGSESSEIVGMFDMLPTLAEFAGARVPTDRKLDGRDIGPLLVAGSPAAVPHDHFFYYRGLKLLAVRDTRYKLHLERGELFDLTNDVSESTDIAAANPEIVARLQQLANTMQDDLGQDGTGPGCRSLGRVTDSRPLLDYQGEPRDGFAAPTIVASQGIMVAEVSETTAIAQVRLAHDDGPRRSVPTGVAGRVRFAVTPIFNDAAATPSSEARTAVADGEHDFIARVILENLKPDTRYRIDTMLIDSLDQEMAGPSAEFRTLAGAAGDSPVRLVVVTGMNYAKFHGDQRIDRQLHRVQNNTDLPPGYARPDRHLGYPALETIHRLRPDFVVGTGDNVYYDSPTQGRAVTLEAMREKWHEQFEQHRYHRLFSRVPFYWMVDDHDYRRDDCDNTGDYGPSPELGLRVLQEQLPYPGAGQGDHPTYRTYRLSRDLQIWLPEHRLHRSPNRTPDGPDKTIWGEVQREWLKRTLAESDATFKLLVSPTPMVGPDDKRKKDNHTNIGGFQHERDDFFAWLEEQGLTNHDGFAVVCGDRHWQYHATHPAGIDEFSCGALVDANSRLGRRPGDPQSTDPDGTIVQHYTQQERSGGFLWIETGRGENATATLQFRFFDEQGTELYQVTRQK